MLFVHLRDNRLYFSTNHPTKVMTIRSVVRQALLLAMAMLLVIRPANAFEIRPVCNTTKNRLMMPLNLDSRLLASRDSESEAPRGIVLNTAVGGLTFAGGLTGFLTKGSKASLIAGSTFGGLLLVSALLISKSSETKSTTGNILGFSVSGMLGYVMGKKFLVSKKFMPAGLLASLSAIAFCYNLIEARILRKKKKEDSTSSVDVDESDATNNTHCDLCKKKETKNDSTNHGTSKESTSNESKGSKESKENKSSKENKGSKGSKESKGIRKGR